MGVCLRTEGMAGNGDLKGARRLAAPPSRLAKVKGRLGSPPSRRRFHSPRRFDRCFAGFAIEGESHHSEQIRSGHVRNGAGMAALSCLMAWAGATGPDGKLRRVQIPAALRSYRVVGFYMPSSQEWGGRHRLSLEVLDRPRPQTLVGGDRKNVRLFRVDWWNAGSNRGHCKASVRFLHRAVQLPGICT